MPGFLRQNEGHFSRRAREWEFPGLTDAEVEAVRGFMPICCWDRGNHVTQKRRDQNPDPCGVFDMFKSHAATRTAPTGKTDQHAPPAK
jgi:hypothetical protein